VHSEQQLHGRSERGADGAAQHRVCEIVRAERELQLAAERFHHRLVDFMVVDRVLAVHSAGDLTADAGADQLGVEKLRKLRFACAGTAHLEDLPQVADFLLVLRADRGRRCGPRQQRACGHREQDEHPAWMRHLF
jgi:hypothetical protein